jgi:hypothetical protein
MRSIRRWIHRPSPGTAIACVALMVALGGTANALDGVNTVENDDLKNNSVGHGNLKTDSVRRAEIKAGAVQNEELGTIVERDGPNVTINDPANDGDWSTGTEGTSQSQAQCNEGEKLMGGTLEWDTDGSVNGDLSIVKMFPHFADNLRTWTVVGASDEGTSEQFHAVAFCLQ